ncbi:DUF397 domain-containing protein [Streptomyces venezuelae]|uniref:DUF397 domain-containing protein n=1 Tax=Streptomyces venezuelae TaxID=54571 RepID=UPI003663F752
MNPETVVTEFRKSSHSNQQGDCLEMAHTATGGRTVRDSKNPAGPALTFEGAAWRRFVDEIKGADAR